MIDNNHLDTIQQEYENVNRQIKKLKGLERKYYNTIPNRCWMTEQTQAELLKTTRRQIRNVKTSLVEKNILQILLSPNGRRTNPVHTIVKVNPIRYLSLMSLGRDYQELEENYSDIIDYKAIERDYRTMADIKWELLMNYTADDINKMSKLEKIELYQECNFLVLPTNYPIYTPNGVKCSCYRGYDCHSKGKHPIHAYKFITDENYHKMRARYLREFKANQELNIGFKVSGFSVLDLDFPHGGKESFEEMTQAYQDDSLRDVMTVASANGLHLYVDNLHLKNTANVVGRGMDIRSEGGFILAPGSLHNSGREYSWKHVADIGTIPDDWVYQNPTLGGKENETIPTTFKEARKNPHLNKSLKDIIIPKGTPPSDYVIEDGARNSTLFKFACRERGFNKDYEDCLLVIKTIRDTYCVRPIEITDSEVTSLVDNVYKSYHTNQCNMKGLAEPNGCC